MRSALSVLDVVAVILGVLLLVAVGAAVAAIRRKARLHGPQNVHRNAR